MARRVVLIVVVTGIIAGGLWLRSYLAPENVIRRSFFAAVESFEREELLPLMAVFDRGYHDPWGQRYESLAGNFKSLFDDVDALEVMLEEPQIVVHGEAAEMTLRFVVMGTAEGKRGYVAGSPMEPGTATLGWAKRAPGWRIETTSELDIPELREESEAATGSR